MRAALVCVLASLFLFCTPARPSAVGSPSAGPLTPGPETTAIALAQERGGQESSAVSTGDEAWRWVERISWLVAIAGILVLVVDVRRGTHELLRRPKMQIGAYSGLTREFSASFRPFKLDDTSEALNLSVCVRNIGNRTAHDATWTLLFPQYVDIEPYEGAQPIEDVGYGGEPTPLKAIQGTRERFTPATQALISARFRMRSRISAWKVIVILRWDDDEELNVCLHVKITMPAAAH